MILNLKYDSTNISTDLETFAIRESIIRSNKLELISVDEHFGPNSFHMIIDGILSNRYGDDVKYRVCVMIKDRILRRDVELTACGSGWQDRLKALLSGQDDIVYDMEASCEARSQVESIINYSDLRQALIKASGGVI